MGLEAGAIAAIAAAAIPLLTAAGKELFGPSTGDVSEAGAKKIQNMQQAAGAYGAYRKDIGDARMKAMAQQMSAYQGAGNIMQALYGGGGQADMGGFKGGSTYTPPAIPPIGSPIPPAGGGSSGGGGTSGPSMPPEFDPTRGNVPKTPGLPQPGNTPQTPPIIPPGMPTNGPGSTGESLVGPSPLALALMGQGLPPPYPISPMAAALAKGTK